MTIHTANSSLRNTLLNWIKETYKGRLIRISGEPYFVHLLAVAEMAGAVSALAYEIGLCHDLLEDTRTTAAELQAKLQNIGYEAEIAGLIQRTVVELTDIYTEAVFPELSKKERKQKEHTRLADISPLAQTVKYADLIYNIEWTIKYQPGKAAKYLKKKKKLLKVMDKGNLDLRHKALLAIKMGLKQAN